MFNNIFTIILIFSITSCAKLLNKRPVNNTNDQYQKLLNNPKETYLRSSKNKTKVYDFGWSSKLNSKAFQVIASLKGNEDISNSKIQNIFKHLELSGKYLVKRITPSLARISGVCDRDLNQRKKYLYHEFKNGRDNHSPEYLLSRLKNKLGETSNLYKIFKNNSDRYFNELVKASVFCYKKGIAKRSLPKDKYRGRDKKVLKKMIFSEWKERYPKDKIMRIVFHSNKWKHFAQKRWNSGDKTWRIEDNSTLNTMVVIKKNKKIATAFLVEVKKNHLNKDMIHVVIPSKQRSARNDMLIKKVLR